MNIRSNFYPPLILTLILCIPAMAPAQQMIVDDATIAQTHIMDAWAGTEESWIQPNLSFSPSWNVNPGIILNTSNQQIDPTNWLIENKLVSACQPYHLQLQFLYSFEPGNRVEPPWGWMGFLFFLRPPGWFQSDGPHNSTYRNLFNSNRIHRIPGRIEIYFNSGPAWVGYFLWTDLRWND